MISNLYAFAGLIAGRVYLIEDPDRPTLIPAWLARGANKIIGQIEIEDYGAA